MLAAENPDDLSDEEALELAVSEVRSARAARPRLKGARDRINPRCRGRERLIHTERDTALRPSPPRPSRLLPGLARALIGLYAGR